jgi:hypothetical protein
MLPAATNPAPRLTPDDTLLLEAFLACRRNRFALARQMNRPADVLFAWFDQPHIQHALSICNTNEEHDHRSAARAHLRAVADTAENPTERRRAATSLLYSLARPVRSRADDSADPSATPGTAATAPARSSAPARASILPAQSLELPPESSGAPRDSADLPIGSTGPMSPIGPTPPTETLLDDSLDRELDEELDEEDEDPDLDAALAHIPTDKPVLAEACERLPPELHNLLPPLPSGP